MNTLIQLTAFLVVVALSSSSVVQSPASREKTFELLILHNNDMHARFEQTSQLSGTCTPPDREAGKCYGGFPRVAYVVKEARKAAASGEGPPVLYLNAGDTYTGTAWFTIYKWKIAAEFVNALQPDAVSLGNHEFDNGVSGLTPFIENLTTPVLAANLILNKVPELERQPNLKKSITFDVAGTKVGVIGYLTPETKVLAVKNDVEYVDEIIALKEEVANLQKEGIKIIIALGHSGYLRDLQIAREVEGIDLVIGGHSNTFLWNGTSPDAEEIQGPYPTYVKQKSGRTVLVVQAYAYTKYLGKLHLVFNSNGEVISADGQPILLDNTVPQDPDILQIVNRYGETLNYLTDVVGDTSVLLDGLGCQSYECNLGNMIADAMFYTYTADYKGANWTDVNVAVIQGGGIRSSISHEEPNTKITKGDLINVLPFGGNLTVLTVNGSVIFQMLEHSVASYDLLDPPGELLHFSGMRVVFDMGKRPGHRVVNAKIRCTDCKIPQYFDLVKGNTYKILIPKFLADGGDNYSMLIDQPTQVLSYNELYCTEFYLKIHSPVFPEVEGRVIYLNMDRLTSLSVTLSPSLALLMFLVLGHWL